MLSILVQDLSVPHGSTWQRHQWPPNLMLPMMLMRENLKQSIFQSVGVTPSPSLDLSYGKPKTSRPSLTPPLQQQQPQQQETSTGGGFVCGDCGRTYKLKSSLRNHQKWECGKEPQFQCPYCIYKAKQKMHMARHMERMHREIDYSRVIKKEFLNKDDNESGSELDLALLKNVTAEMRIDEDSQVMDDKI